MLRVRRPTLSGSPLAPSTTGTIPASQHSLRAVSAAMAVRCSISQRPARPSASTSASTWTTISWRSGASAGASPDSNSRSAIHARASARHTVRDGPRMNVPRGTSSGANPSLSQPVAGCSSACAAIAASSALRMRAPISGGNRPCSTTVPSSSCQKVRPRSSCCASARSVSSARFARRWRRTNFSTCCAVPWSPMLRRSASFPAVAMRVSARTLEYPNSPFANASESSGSSVSARATRTFSRAVCVSMPQAQLSQWAQDNAPCAAQTSRRSSSAMRTRRRYVAA